MKKLFTTLAAVSCVLAGTAQTLTFSHDGVPIENGATLCSGNIDSTFEQLLDQARFLPEIDVTSSVSGTIFVSLQSLDKDNIEFCAIDNTCIFTGTNNNYIAEKTGKVDADKPVPLEIHWTAGPLAQSYKTTSLVSAWYEGKESEKVSFTLIMTNDEGLLSIPGTEAGAPRITVDAGVLHYSFPEPGTHTLSVYATDGAKVADYALSGQEGTVPLDGLHAGLYVYKTDGGAETSGKFIVK